MEQTHPFSAGASTRSQRDSNFQAPASKLRGIINWSRQTPNAPDAKQIGTQSNLSRRGQGLAKQTTTRVTNHNSSAKLTRLVPSGETQYGSGLELALQSLEWRSWPNGCDPGARANSHNMRSRTFKKDSSLIPCPRVNQDP